MHICLYWKSETFSSNHYRHLMFVVKMISLVLYTAATNTKGYNNMNIYIRHTRFPINYKIITDWSKMSLITSLTYKISTTFLVLVYRTMWILLWHASYYTEVSCSTRDVGCDGRNVSLSCAVALSSFMLPLTSLCASNCWNQFGKDITSQSNNAFYSKTFIQSYPVLRRRTTANAGLQKILKEGLSIAHHRINCAGGDVICFGRALQ